MLDSVNGDSALSFTTAKFWVAEFKRGLGDDERSVSPKTATTQENIAKVHQMVLDDRRIKVRGIAEVMKMSKERVYHILNQHLGMRKLSARWVPRLLTVDQKRVRMNISNALLAPKLCRLCRQSVENVHSNTFLVYREQTRHPTHGQLSHA